MALLSAYIPNGCHSPRFRKHSSHWSFDPTHSPHSGHLGTRQSHRRIQIFFILLTSAIIALIAQPIHAQHTADARWLAVNAAHAGAAILDIESTQHCLAARTCAEGNPWMPKSQLGQLGVTLGMSAASVGVSYYLRKNHSRWWWLPTTMGIAAHGYGISTGAKYFEWRFVLP